MKCKKCRKEIENLKVCPYCKSKQISKKIIKDMDDTSKEIEEKVEKLTVLNNPEIISYFMIGLLMPYIVFSAYKSDYRLLGFVFNNLLSIDLLVYFILIQFDAGKKHFKYLNIITVILLAISLIKMSLNTLVGINLVNIFSFLSYLLLTILFIKSFLGKEVKDIEKINIINDRVLYYLVLTSFLLTFIFIGLHYINNIDSLVLLLNILKLGIIFFFSRFIYISSNKKLDMFKKINKLSKNTTNNIIGSYIDKLLDKYNFYQLAAFIIFGCGVVLSLIMGSEYSSCRNNIYGTCLEDNFNVSLMIITVSVSFLIAVLLYWMGEVRTCLIIISENTTKKVKKSVKNIDKV